MDVRLILPLAIIGETLAFSVTVTLAAIFGSQVLAYVSSMIVVAIITTVIITALLIRSPAQHSSPIIDKETNKQ